MRPLAGLAALAVVGSLGSLGVGARPAWAEETPREALGRARQAFQGGRCTDASPLLSYLLYPTPRLADTEALLEAHLLLGVCNLDGGDRPAAAREFEQALFLDASARLDPLLFSAEVVRYYDEIKATVAERNRRDEERRALAIERDRLRKYRESLIVYEVRPYYVNFVPFGAGQLQNGQRGTGVFFATTQGATAAASAGIWLYLVGTYGFGGRVPPDEAAGVLRLEQIEVVAGSAFIGLYIWGFIDSLAHYKPRAQVEGDDDLLPEDMRPAKATGNKPSAGTPLLRPLVAPMFTPSGSGLAAVWEF